MNATQETYLPGLDTAPMARVDDFLRVHDDPRSADTHFFLCGATSDDRVELPGDLYLILRQAAESLRSGIAVSVAPVAQTLTTQQAAELLGVSRPTVIRLLDDGEIPFERVGSHRRITVHALLAFRERRRADQYAALEATRVDEDEPLDETLRRLQAARREVSRRRRGISNG